MTLRGFDLNLVPALSALLQEQNVTRAAERLSMGQPAMSAALARLRRHFDDPLLVRRKGTYTLSTLAESLIEPVAEAMKALEVATDGHREFDAATSERCFTIAASDYVSLVFLRPLLARLMIDAPKIRLRVAPVVTDMSLLLNQGILDLVIAPVEIAGPLMRLPRKALFEDRFVLAADRDNPMLSDFAGLDDAPDPDAGHTGVGIDMDLLQRLPFAAFTGALRSLVDVRLEERGVELQIDVSSEAFLLVPMLLPGTKLVCFTQERLARLMAESAHLKLYRSPVDIGGLRECLFWGRRSIHDPAHRWLRSTLIAHAQQFSPMSVTAGEQDPSSRRPEPALHESFEGPNG